MKIDQKREELQIKLNQLDRQIEANKNDWRIAIKTDIEMKVGCVLMELLQKHEIDGSKFNKARQDLICLKDLFNLFDNEEFIFINNNEEKHMNFNSPQLNFSSLISNDIDWIKNFSSKNSEEINNSLDNIQNSMKEKSPYQISPCKYIRTAP
jgi:hypothetical protein